MKGIFRTLAIVVLLAALAGTVVLVKRNQETRRGAAANETISQILPDKLDVEPGQEFSVNLWVNTGRDSDKLVGAEIVIATGTSFGFLKFEPKSGYTQINDTATMYDRSGNITLKLVAMGEEKGGAIDLGKLTLTAGINGTGSIAAQGKLMISGQAGTWDVARNLSSRVTVKSPIISGTSLNCGWCGLNCTQLNSSGMMCAKIAPPKDKKCTESNGKCVIVPLVTPSAKPTLTPTTGPRACGQRCGGLTGLGCAAGMTCVPMWWPCEGIASGLNIQLEKDVAIDKTMAAEIISKCPMAAKVMPQGYEGMTTFRMPAYYGVCRNAKCTKSTDCSCSGTNPTPTTAEAKMYIKADKSKVTIGEDVWMDVVVEAPGSKISAVNTRIKFFTDNASLEEVVTENGGTEVKKLVDKNGRTATLYFTWSEPKESLKTVATLARLRFKTTGGGFLDASFDPTYKNEVSGVSANGESQGFKLTTKDSGEVEINSPKMCTECPANSSNGKGKGNANCDAQVDSVDFEIWRSEMFDLGGLSGKNSSSWKSDFSCDSKVSGADFEIWRNMVFK